MPAVATRLAAPGGGLRLAVIGAGWAGLAAAVCARRQGWSVTVMDMAPRAGGRARSWQDHGRWTDNGQHILIGAYTRTLGLMQAVGVDIDDAFDRRPLLLQHADGSRLQWGRGGPSAALLHALRTARGWTLRDRLALLGWAVRWRARQFRCDPAWTVDRLLDGLPLPVRRRLLEPLCVAALNTPASAASASVFLRVLADTIAGGRGASDLLLPRRPLQALLPDPAVAWLQAHGAAVRLGHRVKAVALAGDAVEIDGEAFDAAVLATSAVEAARLAAPTAAAWAAQAARLDFESIVTVWLRCPGLRLPAPMMALDDGPDRPAQFLFDLGALLDPRAEGSMAGRLAAVVSGANAWVEAGLDAVESAVLRQLNHEAAALGASGFEVERTLVERRATFRCLPGLDRPAPVVAPRLVAAADFVDGPYPATLEGAVRAGEAAIDHLARFR